MKGTVQDAIDHVREVAKSCRLKMSVCGKKGAPTLRFFVRDEPASQELKEIRVDLKWSLWTTDSSIWEEYAPGALEQMRKAFEGKGDPIIVQTAPRKEIHFGTVTISKGTADGVFTTEWDEPEDLAETLGVECDDAFREAVPCTWENMAPGVAWNFKNLKAKKFETLMRQIDEQNNNLLKNDEGEWLTLKKIFADNK